MKEVIDGSKRDVTKEHLVALLPKARARHVTDDLVKLVNCKHDESFRQVFKENLFSFSSLFNEFPNVGVTHIVQSIMFASRMLLGDTPTDAYMKVFPERFQRLVDRYGSNRTKIGAFASAFARNKVVVRIMELSIVPIYILHLDLHHQAVKVQADLMENARSETVRQKAAECLIQHLKPPEDAVVNINVSQTGAHSQEFDDLKNAMRELAVEQKSAIINNRQSPRQIAESVIVPKEVEMDETEEGEWEAEFEAVPEDDMLNSGQELEMAALGGTLE